MALIIEWTKRAHKKHFEIIEYLTAEWGENSAKMFVKTVDSFLEILAEFPEIGSVENTERNIRGFVITKQTTVFYRIRKNKLILLNFFNNRQHPSKRLR